MRGLPFAFFVAGAISVTIGMVWGIQMSASHDHTLAPAHAHLNLLGWVTFSIFAFYYHLVPHAARGILPKIHFGTALSGLAVLVPGIALAIQDQDETLAKIGSVLSLISMLMFVFVVLRAGRQVNDQAKMEIA